MKGVSWRKAPAISESPEVGEISTGIGCNKPVKQHQFLKLTPQKPMGFNHLQLMAETALSTRNSNRENLFVHLGSKDGFFSPEIVKKLAIFVPWYWYGRWTWFFFNPEAAGSCFFSKRFHIAHLKYRCNSSIRVCLPDLCSWCLPAGCRVSERVWLGALMWRLAFHRQRWNATIVQHSILCLLHPGRLTWNLLINHLERKMIFQTSMIMFHVNLPGCTYQEISRVDIQWRSALPDLCFLDASRVSWNPFLLWLFSASEVLFALGSPVSKIYRIQHTQECRFSMNSQLDGVSSCINVDYMRFVQNCVDESRHAVIMHISDLH